MWEGLLGEIRIFSGDFAPAGWAFCNGQLLSVALFEQLFSVIGPQFGGDVDSTFALPRLADPAPGTQYIICVEGVYPVQDSSGGTAMGYMGEIRLFAGAYAPQGWHYCDGIVAPIFGGPFDPALVSLLFNRFGGDGRTTFALPTLADLAPSVKYVICVEGIFPSPN